MTWWWLSNYNNKFGSRCNESSSNERERNWFTLRVLIKKSPTIHPNWVDYCSIKGNYLPQKRDTQRKYKWRFLYLAALTEYQILSEEYLYISRKVTQSQMSSLDFREGNDVDWCQQQHLKFNQIEFWTVLSRCGSEWAKPIWKIYKFASTMLCSMKAQ